ncbi:hypothetical protein SISNIDRAFT_446833 [Sistotremastrum niveocremeum HHB9708]|uniref:L-lactate dehydrogenase (cytochrome) n=1 Tax=Sistotremastrum niveocremeum HHB9708 TaxID=1314777 RepID=A0A164N6Y4_9AGAM|nr:hypothetical protein SISNIDRAFT_446833 [Sistotremastrum niveocremeum HHB9708]
MIKTVTRKDVSDHRTASSCWIIIQNRIYDVTSFVPHHPGGSKLILNYAGRDATKAFEEVHTGLVLEETLQADALVGELAVEEISRAGTAEQSIEDLRIESERRRKPPLNQILNLRDIESVAEKVVSRKTFAFWSGGSEDEITLQQNSKAFSRFFFVPRVLRRIQHCDPSTIILGYHSSLPIYASATSLGKLAHPKAETNVTRACGKLGIIQMSSTHASSSPSELISSRIHSSQPLWFQLYKKADNQVAATLIRHAETLGFKALCLTVDAASHGNRERDLRAQFISEDDEVRKGVEEMGESSAKEDMIDDEDVNLDGTSGALLKGDDADMTWEETIPWLRSVTKMPIILKGIQCVEDAVLAAESGVDGIIISNHGGRQMEYSLPSIEVLNLLRKQRPDVFQRLEVYVDGGFRRGTEVLKALCLGAKAVGLGRPFLYANAAYGENGIVKTIRILERELITDMRLLSASCISDLRPEMVERVDVLAQL